MVYSKLEADKTPAHPVLYVYEPPRRPRGGSSSICYLIGPLLHTCQSLFSALARDAARV